MDFKNAVRRVRRGLREERRLYFVAVTSLAVAFLCVAGVLLGVWNLSQVADRWGRSARLSVYLEDGASKEDVSQLMVVLEGLAETKNVEHLSSEQARAEFLKDSDVDTELAALPAEAFPASLELEFKPGVTRSRMDQVVTRLSALGAVSEIETYEGWFARLAGLIRAGKGLAMALALLVGLCVLAVIGNTIRLAVARRQQEIEVMKLCGATDSFVRGPFVFEGVFQGVVSATLAIVLLAVAFGFLRDRVDNSIAEIMGTKLVFLDTMTIVAIIASGAIIGAIGSAFSLRRYLDV